MESKSLGGRIVESLAGLLSGVEIVSRGHRATEGYTSYPELSNFHGMPALSREELKRR